MSQPLSRGRMLRHELGAQDDVAPSIDGPGSGASRRPPGSSSSIGKLITSVGPGRSIQRMCRSAMAAVSSKTISSAAGCTCR